MTKHRVVTGFNQVEFQEVLDKVSSEENVFATQTHVTVDPTGNLQYTAICFIRE